ncbi:MAG: hypothetical protein EPO68_16855 [Planctomycetota bacterium]|nr:MAG: hypothetical protein EPO68_16855 [Planctomycetota bacterium]
MNRSRSLFVFAFPLAAFASAQQVHVVAPSAGPGVDFTSISAAVAAAQDGDLVLVKSGTYAPFQIQSKGVHVVEDAGADARIGIGGAGICSVSNTLADQTAWLHGFASASPLDFAIDACTGPVLLTGLTWTSGTAGSRMTASDAVMLRSCSFTGAAGHSDCTWVGSACACSQLHAGAPGLFATDSRISVHSSVLNGGYGLSASGLWPCFYSATPGGPGLLLANSRALMQSICHGGPGGAGIKLLDGTCAELGAPGAAGVLATDAASHIDFTGPFVSAADGAGGLPPCGSVAPSAPDYDGPQSGIGVIGYLPTLLAPAVVREGQSATLSGRALPGFTLLAVSGQADLLEIPGLLGWAVPTAPALFALPTTPPGGLGLVDYSLTLPITELGAGVDFVIVHAQVIQLDTSGTGRVGESRPIALLDAQF